MKKSGARPTHELTAATLARSLLNPVASVKGLGGKYYVPRADSPFWKAVTGGDQPTTNLIFRGAGMVHTGHWLCWLVFCSAR